MIRARFYVNPDDYRPVNWPIKHPYWCSGSTDENNIIVAYADDVKEILENWPDAVDIDFEERTEYIFTDRFPKPSWFKIN
jgi:hypothetical protein